jgi:hypothetical protein
VQKVLLELPSRMNGLFLSGWQVWHLTLMYLLTTTSPKITRGKGLMHVSAHMTHRRKGHMARSIHHRAS